MPILTSWQYYLVGLLAALFGCRNTIRPPQLVAEPVAVFVVDHGRHASLVVPGSGGGFVHYSFGAWRWYALSEESFATGAAAVFGTEAALGRRRLDVAGNPGAIQQAMVEGAAAVLPVSVDAHLVAQLRDRLDREFTAHAASEVVNATYALDFVQTGETYSIVNNSNSHVARWLEELGCAVNGFRLYSAWQVEPQ